MSPVIRPFALAVLLSATCVIALAQDVPGLGKVPETKSGEGQGPETRIIEQPGSPVTITKYTAVYYDRGISSYITQGIHHSVEFQSNEGSRGIVAVEIGLVSFDVWNEFLDRTYGLSRTGLAPLDHDKGTWITSRYADFSFRTGVAFVNRVRFADGAIWSADTSAVTNELRKIEKNFDAAKLKKSDDAKP